MLTAGTPLAPAKSETSLCNRNPGFNGGGSWSSIYNQNTAQFYRLDVDDQYPYRVYGTQQDNTSISVPSAWPSFSWTLPNS